MWINENVWVDTFWRIQTEKNGAVLGVALKSWSRLNTAVVFCYCRRRRVGVTIMETQIDVAHRVLVAREREYGPIEVNASLTRAGPLIAGETVQH